MVVAITISVQSNLLSKFLLLRPAAAAEATEKLPGAWERNVDNDYAVRVNEGVSESDIRLRTLSEISESDNQLAENLASYVPQTAGELVEQAHDCAAGDLFPKLSNEELARIAGDGKMPKHAFWAERIKSGELAIDTLLNLAGLASFASDQEALDNRIRKLMG